MPKLIAPDLLDRVSGLLASAPAGLRLAELEQALQSVASRRSLQRHLVDWLHSGAIRAQGVRRGRRYFIGGPAPSGPTYRLADPSAESEIRESGTGSGIPLSTAARALQALVRRPIADRLPVGYERTFLERYVPNDTAYLPSALRAHLHALGRTPIGDRPAGTYARDILDRLLIDLSFASSRLEGNTYSLLDTRALIERGQVAAGKDVKETQMILNHKAAIELLVASGDEVGVNRYTLTNLHTLLSDNLLEDPRHAGRLRTSPVGIVASTYLPTAVPPLIEEMFDRLIECGAAIRDPFEQSFFLMVQLPYLQPFVDVNKRTSRLAANIPLIRQNLVPLSFLDVPEQTYVEGLVGLYEQRRIELLRDLYLWAYERSVRQYKTARDSLPEPDPFRLRYRESMIAIIGDLVRGHHAPTADAIAERARPLVDAADLQRFTQLIISEVDDLHDGNIARYRLRPAEFSLWRERSAGARKK